MGLTRKSTGASVDGSELIIRKSGPNDRIIALAGNPNVGKSTVFNALTGMKQHTGNWPGKTVSNAQGEYIHNGNRFIMVDIPGTYSLMANSAEEEVARDFICFGSPDTTIVVTDATCLERNLNLVLQTLEITDRVVVCVNLLDEAKKKKIRIDLDELSLQLGVPVVGTSARGGKGLTELMNEVEKITFKKQRTFPPRLDYGPEIEKAIETLLPLVAPKVNGIPARWVCLKLLDLDEALQKSLTNFLGIDLAANVAIKTELSKIWEAFKENGIIKDNFRDMIVSKIVERAEQIYKLCVFVPQSGYNGRDRKIDRILTSKSTGIPIMILLLGIIFWITIVGANYPSEILSTGLFWIEDRLTDICFALGAPPWIQGLFVEGMYRTLAWVISVMLPPMAIFFPLFTLLEDSGYLPRIAFNMDKYFKKACAHGKQALTMAMGFGCNACGVVGCRIIDSPRERLIATITNNFVPCNGRFPALIAIITMFFAGNVISPLRSIVSAVWLMAVIVLGVGMTLLVSRILSKTFLKGVPSSFALELPPYRRPQIGKVIIRSVFDRTLFVLGRAVTVAAPAGLIIWLLANIKAGDATLLAHCAAFLDPFGRLIGLDGVILIAFILGFPANEIVIPLIIMTYLANGSMVDMSNLEALRELLVSNGWTSVTALCTMLFSLMHFPCATTMLTIRKETKSLKWTFLSFAIPTVMGIVVCFVVSTAAHLFRF